MTTNPERVSTEELLRQYGAACAEVATTRDDRKAVEPFNHAMDLKRQILARVEGS